MSAERPPLLPVQLFGELFEYAALWQHDSKAQRPEFKAERVVVSCYLCHSTAHGPRHPALEIRPTPAVLEVIGREMLAIDRDRIYFEIITFDDGTSTVYAQYNQILGSRKLANIHTDTIPTF